ncbi:MAG: NAD-dependent epimerase/dehydratase family protein [Calditrichia bacterium]
MRIIITGATGFIGNYLCKLLLEHNYEIVVLTRNASKARKNFGSMVTCVEWDARTNNGWQEYAEGAYAIINLAGAGIADNLWTKVIKNKYLKVASLTKAVVAIEAADEKPRNMTAGSATGIYASRGDEVLDESSAKGDSFWRRC